MDTLNIINLIIIYLSAYEDETDSVPKRRHIKFRRRGITQKETYNKLCKVASCWIYIGILQSGPKKCIHSLLINIFGLNLNEISFSG
jgi:hypothetical protein